MPEKKEEGFYKSLTFEKILNTINKLPAFYSLKEKNNKLYIYVNKCIMSIDGAKDILHNFE